MDCMFITHSLIEEIVSLIVSGKFEKIFIYAQADVLSKLLNLGIRFNLDGFGVMKF